MTFGYRSLISLFEYDGLLCSEICMHLCYVMLLLPRFIMLIECNILEHVWRPQWRKRALRTVDRQIPS
jgi:hypothetical protein